MGNEKLYNVNLTDRELCELHKLIGIIAWKSEKELERITKECEEFTSEKFMLEYPRALITPEEKIADLKVHLEERTIDYNNVNAMYQRINEAHSTIKNSYLVESFERSISEIEHIADLYKTK